MPANSPIRLAFPARLLAVCFLFFAAAPIPGLAQTKTSLPRSQRHEYRHEIDQLEEDWRNAMLKGNSAALDNLLADDYTAITAMGAIQNKQQAVANLRSGAFQLTALNVTDRKVRIYGSTAVVTSLADLTGTRNEQDVTGRYRYTRVYVRNSAGQWKIVSFEASRIQEPGERK
jgi:ketosteroid isomerase-like protein